MAAKNDRSTSAFVLNPSDRKFPRLDPNKASEDVQAVLSKLVGDKVPRPKTTGGNRAIQVPDQGYLKQISDATAARIGDSESIFQTLPDTELSMQILVSSIISPKDMTSTELTFTVESGSMETELVGAMLQVVEEYFDKTYKIKNLLTPILQDVLFLTGSYPLMVLPENTIDEAINSPGRVSVESLRSELGENGDPLGMGLLGPAKLPNKPVGLISLESIYGELPHAPTTVDPNVRLGANGIDVHLSVVDNPSILKLPILRDKVRQDRIQDALSMRHVTARRSRTEYSLEARGQKRAKEVPTTAQVEASLYKKRQYKNVPVMNLVLPDTLERSTIGHPMVNKLPSESVIPVHVPSNPDEHIGYFVLIDDFGNPVVKARSADYYTDLSSNISSNNDMVTQILASARRGQSGRQTDDKTEQDAIVRAYAELVEEDLLARLRNGVYGDDVAISRPQEVYSVMLARTLAQQNTKLLYVPAELMTYIAFDYNSLGIGSSLLEKGRILGSIRTVMLFASSMAMIKNSVAREVLNITLDAADKNPSKTVEFLIGEYAKTRSAGYPVGATSPVDIVKFLGNAGVSVAVSGNTGYPETRFEVEDKASAKVVPNTELMEELKNQHIMSLGLSPETVNASANAEFATTVVNSNLMLAKRVIQYQDKLCGFLSDHVQKYTLYSGYLMDALREVVSKHKSSVKKAVSEARATAKEQDATAKDNLNPDGTPPEGTETTEEPETEEEDDTEQEDTGGALESFTDPTSKRKPTKATDRSKLPGANIVSDPSDQNLDRYGDDAIIMEFIRGMRVSLPAPDTVSLDTQMKAFDAYSEALEKALKAYLDTSFLTDATVGDLSDTVEATVAVVKAYFQRQWLRTNNVLSELDILTNMGGDGDPFDLLETQEGHVEGLMTSIGEFMKKLKEKLIEKGFKEGEQAISSAGGDEFGNPDATTTGGTDDGTGTDDLSLDTSLDTGDGTGSPAEATTDTPAPGNEEEPTSTEEEPEETPAPAPASEEPEGGKKPEGEEEEEEEGEEGKKKKPGEEEEEEAE